MSQLPPLPPRCLLPFACHKVSPAAAGLPEGLHFNSFTLICPCGGDIWKLHGYWLGDREALIGPLAVECTQCAAVRELIDTTKDGHDAEIGDSLAEQGAGPRTTWICENCSATSGPLIASFGYQFEPDAEAAVRQQDYFDAFILTHLCGASRKPQQVTMFDCA